MAKYAFVSFTYLNKYEYFTTQLASLFEGQSTIMGNWPNERVNVTNYHKCIYTFIIITMYVQPHQMRSCSEDNRITITT